MPAHAILPLFAASSSVVPFISVIVPILNEEACIERLARSILDQDYPAEHYEILMADGGSTDRTLEILARIDPARRIRVLRNPGRTAPCGLNVLIDQARGDIVTRIDGHSFIASDYLRQIADLMSSTGASVVGGPVLMHADTAFQTALVEALYSAVAVGSVPYRTLKARAHVASLQTGSFRREVLSRVGRFDESLAVVEDLDLNTRIRKAGYELLLDPAIRFWYVPRGNLRQLWRQIHTVGRVKLRVLRKHPEIFKLKYVLPTTLVLALAAALVASVVGWRLRLPWVQGTGLAFIASYTAVIAGFALSRVPVLGLNAVRLMAIVPTLHIGYGTGFIRGMIDAARLARSRAHA